MAKQQELIASPATYREMSKPFETMADLNGALRAFEKSVRELRQQYKIRDVYIIVGCSAIGDDGEEGELMSSFSCGDPLKGEVMTAWAFGSEQASRRDLVAGILKGK